LLLEHLFDMKKLIKFYLLVFVLFSDFVVFAQPGEGGGDLGGDDPVPVAPINGQLMVLALVGIAYAIYTFRNYKKIV
jgi:hypothetical protein